jgi:hypothetical protein
MGVDHQLLLSAAESGGIVMLARIAMMQALHGRKTSTPEPRRKRAKAYGIIR